MLLTFSWWSTWSFVFPMSAVSSIIQWCIRWTKITTWFPGNYIVIKCNTVLSTETLWFTIRFQIFVKLKWTLYTSSKCSACNACPRWICTCSWNNLKCYLKCDVRHLQTISISYYMNYWLHSVLHIHKFTIEFNKSFFNLPCP